MVRALDLGGSERQLSVLARTLPASEFEVQVGCLRADGARARELTAAGVRIIEFPIPSFRRVSLLTGVYRMLRYFIDNQIQLVHTFDWPMNVLGVPVARAAPGLVVLSSQRAHRELSPGLPRHILRLTDHIVDGIVVNSNFVRRHLTQEEGTPPGKIHLCYNGIDLNTFSPMGRQPATDGSLTIGIVCALRPEKGLETLLDAFARISNVSTGLKLVITGGGPSLDDLQKRAAELGLGSRCTFMPARGDVASLLRQTDIFVLPSLSEAFSNSLMEAMACGCCAVASDVGGNPELVFHEKTGLLFPPRNVEALAARLQLLVENQELRQRLADSGCKLIHTKFSQETSAATMAGIYRQLLGDKH